MLRNCFKYVSYKVSIPGDSEPLPDVQYRKSAPMDTVILDSGYRDSGQMIPFSFIMYPCALKRKYITKEATSYDQIL